MSLVVALVLLCSLSTALSLSVTVFGGGGFTGSRVCKILVDKGATVTSISRTGVPPKWIADEEWTKSVVWKSADVLADPASLDQAVGSPDAVVSCIGVIGTDPAALRRGNGDANIAAFASAKRGGKLRRAAYVSVGSEVDACKEKWLPEFFGGYFDGKQMAEKAALDAMDGDASKVCLIKPTFIYGGADFALIPPRVNNEYGSGVEELLSLPPFKLLAGVTPGLIKVALRPPVSVDSVAAACAKAALDESGFLPVLDGTDQINEYSGQLKATGLTNALEWGKEQVIKFYDWAKVEVPKAIDSVQAKIEESKS